MSDSVPQIEIWRARSEEADEAFCLVQEYFEAVSVAAREDRRKFVEEYFGDGRGFWLARVGNELAGCVALRKLRFADKSVADEMDCAEIKRMYLRTKFRGSGIAQRLLSVAEEYACSAGYAWIYLDTTDEMKAAAKLYERNGYERCERYNENPQATIFMRKHLQTNS